VSHRNHLFLALGRSGWGEVQLAMRVARELQSRGDRVTFLVSRVLAKAFDPGELRVELAPPEGYARIEPHLAYYARELRPATVVFCDYVQVFSALDRRGVDAGFIARLGARLVLMDPWSLRESNLVMDANPYHTVEISPVIRDFPYQLIPVPFARPEIPGGFAVLDAPSQATDAERQALRAELGVDDGERMILLASSLWQYKGYEHSEIQSLAIGVPLLLAGYLDQLKGVKLVHVGAQPLHGLKDLGDRYRWSSSLPSSKFRTLMASSDLVLSLNASATTNTMAVVEDVPVLTLINGFEGDADELEGWLGRAPSDRVRQWAEYHLPTYRFYMWPMSFWNLLHPVLTDNPYAELLHMVQVLDEAAVISSLERLLFDQTARDLDRERRATYTAAVRALPSGADLVERYLAS